MLLAVDIGNTNINFAVFEKNKIIAKFSVGTKAYSFTKIKSPLKNFAESDALICSVVPRLTNIIYKDLKHALRGKIYVLGKHVKVPIINKYREPGQVGQDRLVNAYAGIKLYGPPLVVIDFGTAVTFDIISKKSAYLGGLIIPGIQISLDALHERTALLPRPQLNRPKKLIGQDTKESILSGIIFGFAAIVDNLSRRLRGFIGKKAKVIGTGGDIAIIKDYSEEIDSVRPDLTLQGINLIYQVFRKPGA